MIQKCEETDKTSTVLATNIQRCIDDEQRKFSDLTAAQMQRVSAVTAAAKMTSARKSTDEAITRYVRSTTGNDGISDQMPFQLALILPICQSTRSSINSPQKTQRVCSKSITERSSERKPGLHFP